MPGLKEDLPLLRTFMRAVHLLDPPPDLMKNPQVVQSVLASYARREERAASKKVDGPSRDEMVDLFSAKG
jgi:hypothetical protein